MDIHLKKYENIDFTPTKKMAENAKRGLEMREKQPESNRGGTQVGLARANQLIKREKLSADVVKRMFSFFKRHEVNKQSESWKRGNSKGEQAWLLWGGDAGYKWSERKVNEMNKEDDKKGVGLVEHKQMNIDILEIKQEGSKGTFKAYLNTYNNVDLGRDMTLKSFGDANVDRKVYLLKQHKAGTEHGHIVIGSDQKGMLVSGTLYLEHDEKGNQVFPEAYRTYALLKRGADDGVKVQFSMGFKLEEGGYKYETIEGVTVRKLIKGQVLEGSIVTFAMNPASVQTDEVKMKKEGIEVKKRVMTMVEQMNMDESLDKKYRIMASFNNSCEEIMMDQEMSKEEKKEMIEENCKMLMNEEIKLYSKLLDIIHDENGKMSAQKAEKLGLEIKNINCSENSNDKEDVVEQKQAKKDDMMSCMKKACGMVKKAVEYMEKNMQMETDEKSDDLTIELKDDIIKLAKKMKGSV